VAQQGTCSAECTTYQCKVVPKRVRAWKLRVSVVPHPAQLEDNRDCVCMTCLKACPHRSVELNLRPLELNCGRPMYPVLIVALLFLLLGGVFSIATRVANESGFRFDAILASLGIIAANFDYPS